MAKRGPKQPVPHPFLKWAGGKRGLLDRILPRLPERIETYVEPFVGGGAVFFELARLRRFKRAILGDRNPELVEAWRAVKHHPEALIDEIEGWAYDERVYYAVRDLDPATLPPVRRAARTLWLNRTGFNGLYRMNQSGKFNVPFGRHANPTLVNAENILACSRSLRDVDILEGDFEAILADPRVDDRAVVYLDPPYWPVSRTANFTAYDPFPFGAAEQGRLRDAFIDLRARGAYGVLSNSYVDATCDLYAAFPHDVVYARRSINRNGEGRGEVAELLVRTHERPPARDTVALASQV